MVCIFGMDLGSFANFRIGEFQLKNVVHAIHTPFRGISSILRFVECEMYFYRPVATYLSG